MNISYDYDDLLLEIKSDLAEGLITKTDMIKIVRGDLVANALRPIVDYYYPDNQPQEEYEEMQVSQVLEEMEYYNSIIK